ncbi:rhomboid-like protein [Streptomyces sp. NPDC048644]|uniref:rhomboid-like protein n=1 Tax=Streptomyces sp. NPDC048644 TaxID=3365582 RepID=UPI0037138628
MSLVDTADTADTARAGTGPAGFGKLPRQPAGPPSVRVDEVAPPTGPAPDTADAGAVPAAGRARVVAALSRLRLLLPSPTGTPFTFGYTLVLLVTSFIAAHAAPAFVGELLRGSSTDVAHLTHTPLLVLVASALWIAGGVTSGFAVAFLFVLTALERRIGSLGAAAVFAGGHVLATLATELPVGFAVAAGQLPVSSLHRLDYGISFGVMTCTGALAGLLPGRLRWPLLAGVGYLAVGDVVAFVDPMAAWGHLLALALGVVSWPLLRRRRARRARPEPLRGDLGHPALRTERAG